MTPTSTFDVSGLVAVVTGASSGLGERFARVLHGGGAQVVVAARRRARLDGLVAELGEDSVLAVECDISREQDAVALMEAAVARFGTIDVLVNNAGTSRPAPAEAETTADFEAVVDTNLVGLFTACREAGRVMLERERGSIVNIASILGLVGGGLIKQAGYAASKGAVVNLTRELAGQWARRGVRVNAIAPGWFPSEMTAELMADEGGRRFIRRGCPMGRPGREDELDGVLVLLASGASSYITGQVISVDGGWTCV